MEYSASEGEIVNVCLSLNDAIDRSVVVNVSTSSITGSASGKS